MLRSSDPRNFVYSIFELIKDLDIKTSMVF